MLVLTAGRDHELVTAAARGDRGAWTALVEAYAGLVWSVIAGFGLSDQDSADVSQTTWLRLAQTLDRWPEPQPVGMWLAATARGECRRLTGRSGRTAPSRRIPTHATATDDLPTDVRHHERPDPGWSPRTRLALLLDQLAALDAWNLAARCEVERVLVDDTIATSRERRAEVNRRTQARESERRALIARADAQLRREQAGTELPGARAVVAHRNQWFRDRVVARLADHGIRVVASVDDGAEASAAVLLEQPDLLLVENLLPHLKGRDVIARAREFAPRTVVGAQALGPFELQQLVDAGARAVFTRRIPPVDVVDGLTACLFGQQDVVRLQ